MTRIDDLIAELCPHGVEFRALGEIGELVRGNGMPKSDFVESGMGCIHYGQIYTYYGTWTTTTKSFVPPEKAVKLAKVTLAISSSPARTTHGDRRDRRRPGGRRPVSSRDAICTSLYMMV